MAEKLNSFLSVVPVLSCLALMTLAGARGSLSDRTRGSLSPFMPRVQESYGDYVNHDRYKATSKGVDDASVDGSVSKRNLFWNAGYNGPDGRQAARFWKRFLPSKDSMFWKRQGGVFGESRANRFWKRSPVHSSDAFWKRDAHFDDVFPAEFERSDQPETEDGQSVEKRAVFSLPPMFSPRYGSVVPVPKSASPLDNNLNLEWLTQTLAKNGRTERRQRTSLPLPPKDRRQEPKLNPDFNPTGW